MMTEKEMAISQKIGASALCIYTYIKSFPRSRNMDIEVDLGMSGKTVTSVLKKLSDRNIITRGKINYKTREITVTPEQVWDLQ